MMSTAITISSRMLLLWITTLLLGGLLGACTATAQSKPRSTVQIETITGFPDGELGYAFGVSACYAGVLGNKLIVGGGCNFPDIPASRGGIKRFYKGIYAAKPTNDTTLTWTKIGELPLESAYGVTLSLPHQLILLGGNHADGALSAVYSLSLNTTGDAAILDTLPSLPCALDNMGGAAIGRMLYVLGGNKNGIPSTSLFSFDLENRAAGWKEEAAFPGTPRIQPVCAAQDSALYVWSGFSPSLGEHTKAIVATDGYRYLPKQKVWEPVASPTLPDSEESFTLTGGASIALSDTLIWCVGGVNRAVFLDAIGGSYQRVSKEDYLTQPVGWYRFNDRLLVYNTRRNRWDECAHSPHLARAGAALVRTQRGVFVIGGETKPGIRTPNICRILFSGVSKASPKFNDGSRSQSPILFRGKTQ